LAWISVAALVLVLVLMADGGLVSECEFEFVAEVEVGLMQPFQSLN
jgi:hypothetical protein